MKKHLTLAALLVAALGLKAQQGEIIYRDFEPDSLLVLWSGNNSMTIDLDGEGTSDIEMYYTIGLIGMAIPYINSLKPDSLELCLIDSVNIIPNCEEWNTFLDWWIVYANDRYAFRYKHNDGYLYGWFETFVKEISEDSKRVVHWGLDRAAFCTIPNYPLVWGQTELMDIEETTESVPFAVIHPNPTNGMVTVTGESLRQAEVVNMLGQQVISTQGHGNELQINMAALPAGVYFVTITNEKGQNCVKKVVRE